jgi:hypothetical protein
MNKSFKYNNKKYEIVSNGTKTNTYRDNEGNYHSKVVEKAKAVDTETGEVFGHVGSSYMGNTEIHREGEKPISVKINQGR